MVPREGGNTFHGSWFVGYRAALQGSNYENVPGLSAPNSLQKVWEVTPIIGGPVFKDKLWFLFSARTQGTRNTIAGMYYNLNAGDPTKFTLPNLTTQAVDDGLEERIDAPDLAGEPQEQDQRLLGRAGPEGSAGSAAATQPRSGGRGPLIRPSGSRGQVSWTSDPSRVLFEVAAGLHQLQWNAKERPGYDDTFGKLVRITDQGGNGFVPGITHIGARASD